MTLDFYADITDKANLLDLIFKETNARLFDLYSEPGKEVYIYTSTESVMEKISRDMYDGTFQLWLPEFAGQAVFRLVQLDPRRCEGHTFRYATDGLGLIQMHFGKQQDRELGLSHVGHFNEKSAIRWEHNHILKASAWNWKEITKASRKISYAIQNKWAVKKINGYPVLAGAGVFMSTVSC